MSKTAKKPEEVIVQEPPDATPTAPAGLATTERQHLYSTVSDLEARLAGAEMASAAAKLERDAARQALDLALQEPCSLCGKQRKDTP